MLIGSLQGYKLALRCEAKTLKYVNANNAATAKLLLGTARESRAYTSGRAAARLLEVPLDELPITIPPYTF